MYKYLSLTALTIMILATPKVYAHSISLQLAANGTKSVTNHFGRTLSATCKIQTKSQHKIRVSVSENCGSVNGKNLKSGQARSVMVHNDDSISVSAEPGTQVTLENLGDDPVQATCEA